MKSISRRTFIKKASTAGSVIGLSSISSLIKNGCCSRRSPNLVFIFPDQMRGQAMGFFNEEPVITPHLDAFSKESVVFTHAVSNYPLCSPFRGMLMTGQYPHTSGLLENCHSQSAAYGNELKQDAHTWSDVLKTKGYSLGYIGKWHLDAPHKPYVESSNNRENFAWNEWCPPERRHGFDYWYAYGTFDRHMNPMYWEGNAARDEAHRVDQWGPEHEADQAIAYIKNQGGAYRKNGHPFALVVSMNPPHMPYDQFPRKYLKPYENFDENLFFNRPNVPPAGTKWGDYYRKHIRNYYAMITGVDAQFGRIISTLKEAGLEENTIVVFASDHGNCLGIHEMISKNNHFEESMRIPLMVRWPGRIKPRQDDLLISVPDIFPTLLDLMGFTFDCSSQVQGVRHAGLILNGRGPRPSSQLYLRVPLEKPAFGRRGVRTHRYTLMLNEMPLQPCTQVLYDRQNDPYQLINAADSSRPLVQQLIKDELIPWLKKTNDPWLARLS